MSSARTLLDQQRIDAVLGEIDAETASAPSWRDATTARERDERVGRERWRRAIRGEIASTRALIAKDEHRINKWKGCERVTRGEIEKAEARLAVPLVRGGMEEARDRAEREAFASALRYLRDGVTRFELPGPVIAWENVHPGERLLPLPMVRQMVERAQKDLAPRLERLAAALDAWQAERAATVS
jgi:hypothetical protein